MMTARKAIGSLVLLLSILILAVPTSNYLLAQESTEEATEEETPTPAPTVVPTPTPTAYALQDLGFNLIGQAGIQIETSGNVTASAATLTFPPGTASLQFTVAGPTIVMVQKGEIFITSDNAAVSVVDASTVLGIYPSSGTPGPVETLRVPEGQQVLIPTGATTQIRNDSAAAATVLILSISPAPDR